MSEDAFGLPKPDIELDLSRTKEEMDAIFGGFKSVDPSADAARRGYLKFNEDFVKRSIDLERLGLKLVGYEYETDAGYIDILCRDGDGIYVAIEVKRGVAQVAVVGQLLGYMSMIEGESKGMVIAAGFSARVVKAANKLGIDLVEYRIRVDTEPYAGNTENGEPLTY